MMEDWFEDCVQTDVQPLCSHLFIKGWCHFSLSSAHFLISMLLGVLAEKVRSISPLTDCPISPHIYIDALVFVHVSTMLLLPRGRQLYDEHALLCSKVSNCRCSQVFSFLARSTFLAIHYPADVLLEDQYFPRREGHGYGPFSYCFQIACSLNTSET